MTILRKIRILKKPKKQYQTAVTATTTNCRSILFHCLRNLESKVNEIFANANTFKVDQIKGEKQLTDFAETVNFLSEKIHEFEANTKLKEEIIKSLRAVLHDDFKKNAGTSGPAGTMFLLELSSFYVIKEEKGEDTDSIIIITVKEEIDIEILPNDLSRLHRIGNPKTKKKKMPIIIKFVRYNLRQNISLRIRNC